jgi:hypothetical protein
VHVDAPRRWSQERRAVAGALAGALCWIGAGRAGAAAEPAPAPALGEPAPAPPSADPADVAKAECLSHHEAAQVARRERRLLDTRAALRICSGAACPAAIRADCVDWLDQVAHSVPSVVVTARARGADVLAVRVLIDGKVAAEKLTGFALEIDPGPHKFRFESPPWPAIERDVLASEGVKDRPIDVEFAPPLPDATLMLARTEAPKPFRLERSDYVFGGIALAGFTTLAVFGGTGLYDVHHLQTTCASFCTHEQVQDVRTKLIIADIGMAVGVVALAVGLYLHGKRAF